MGFPGGSDGKEPACKKKKICLQCGRPGFNPWIRKIPWRRKWQPTLVLLPGKSHRQRSLAGYSPWGCKSQTRLSNFTFTVDFPCDSDGKDSACNAGDSGLIFGWGRFPGEGNGNLLQSSCLEKSVDERA